MTTRDFQNSLHSLYVFRKYCKNRFFRTITLQELPSPIDTIFVIFTPYSCSLVLTALGMYSPHYLQHAHMYSSSNFLLVPELWNFLVKLTTHHVHITNTPHTQHGNIQDNFLGEFYSSAGSTEWVFRHYDWTWSWSTPLNHKIDWTHRIAFFLEAIGPTKW